MKGRGDEGRLEEGDENRDDDGGEDDVDGDDDGCGLRRGEARRRATRRRPALGRGRGAVLAGCCFASLESASSSSCVRSTHGLSFSKVTRRFARFFVELASLTTVLL